MAPPAPAGSWPQVLGTLVAGGDLAPDAAKWAMTEIMSGEASSAQIAGFAIGLRAKGETPGEFASLVEVMLERSVRVTVPGRTVDTVGTGGDPIHAINISTLAAIVAAAAGARVVKHGNRAASSASGAADLLEALGVAIELDPAGIARCVEAVGIGFCFAPRFHPSLRYAAVTRRELGVPTVFNFLGPLSNPARPPAQAVGCSNERMAPVLAHALAARGTTGLVSRGDDGLDKLTTCGTTSIWLVSGGEVQNVVLDAVELGIPRSAPGSCGAATRPTTPGCRWPCSRASTARCATPYSSTPPRPSRRMTASTARSSTPCVPVWTGRPRLSTRARRPGCWTVG